VGVAPFMLYLKDDGNLVVQVSRSLISEWEKERERVCASEWMSEVLHHDGNPVVQVSRSLFIYACAFASILCIHHTAPLCACHCPPHGHELMGYCLGSYVFALSL
jgi:hypothetical protein